MPSVTISEKAAAKGNELLRSQAKDLQKPGLRVRVVGGGCSGLMYKMEIGDGAQDGDETFERDGFRVYIDRKSLFFLNGSELDYHEGLTGAGFKFQNPNVKGSCGCGESFHV
jgi:iron-sulfur cluster assembly accessory protein